MRILWMMIIPLLDSVLCNFHSKNRLTPVICTKYVGCMRGRLMRGIGTQHFEAFMGIPYALPPTGDLRFSSPRAYPKWKNTFEAFKVKSDCIQKNYILPQYPVSGSEDCLFLNVYRPVFRPILRKLPVMIYIHGGGWFSGSTNPSITGPEYIMDTGGVVLVTFSYRLGPFGFLSTGDEAIPGNFGLKDQLLAMKWVKNNIKAFGGDPENVTLFGQSAGAISTHMHMLSPQSRGLFQAAIALSGTANVPFSLTENPLQQARRVAELSGINNAEHFTTKQLLQALRGVDAHKLLAAGDGLKYWSVDHLTNFRPVVESANVKDAFFTRHPGDILKSGNYHAVPFMLGTVPHEGAVRALAILESRNLTDSFNENFFNLLKTFLDFPQHMNDRQMTEKTHSIIMEYFRGEQQLNSNTSQGFLDMITDRGFHHPLYNTIKDYTRSIDTAKYPLYLFIFNYTSDYSFAPLYTGSTATRNYGVVHCDDLVYLFRSPILFKDFPSTTTQFEAVQLFVYNVVHFATWHRPIGSVERCNEATFQRDLYSICDYQLFENSKQNSTRISLNIGNKFKIRRMKFWDEILNN